MDHSLKEESRAQKRGDVCIVHSTYFPPGKGQALEVEMQSHVHMEKPLLFEPHDHGRLCGLDAPEAVVTRVNGSKILVTLENNSSLSTRLEPEHCIGTVTPVEVATLEQPDSGEPAESATQTISTLGSANILECSATEDSGDQAARLQKLFNLLSLQDSGVPDQHLQKLKKLMCLHWIVQNWVSPT